MLKATGLFAVEPTSSYSFKIVKSIETVELNEQVEPIEQVEAIEQDSEEVGRLSASLIILVKICVDLLY